MHEPSEGSLYEFFCIFLDALAVSDDQLVEVKHVRVSIVNADFSAFQF